MSAATADERAALAEYRVLSMYNAERELLGHDFGGGQRRAELDRRWGRMRFGSDSEIELTADELLEAFRRVGEPRIARITTESYRTNTPSSRRSLKAWREVRQRVQAHRLVVERRRVHDDRDGTVTRCTRADGTIEFEAAADTNTRPLGFRVMDGLGMYPTKAAAVQALRSAAYDRTVQR